MSRLNDQEEREALLDGASALRYRADRLASYTDMKVNSPQSATVQKFRDHAHVLEGMADCYEVAS